jgi:hypothetical protein
MAIWLPDTSVQSHSFLGVHVLKAYLTHRNGVLSITIRTLIAALLHSILLPNAAPVEEIYHSLIRQHNVHPGISLATTWIWAITWPTDTDI